jgi:hypothetical protein
MVDAHMAAWVQRLSPDRGAFNVRSAAFCALNELLVLFAAAGVFAIKLDAHG